MFIRLLHYSKSMFIRLLYYPKTIFYRVPQVLQNTFFDFFGEINTLHRPCHKKRDRRSASKKMTSLPGGGQALKDLPLFRRHKTMLLWDDVFFIG